MKRKHIEKKRCYETIKVLADVFCFGSPCSYGYRKGRDLLVASQSDKEILKAQDRVSP